MFQVEFSRRSLAFLAKSFSEAFLVPTKDISRILFHSSILAFIVAGFWLLDSLKDPILATTVGIEYQPLAKLFSVICTFIIVCICDFLTSRVSKPMLFHVISIFFGLLTTVISALLSDTKYGLPKSSKNPRRLLGWTAYISTEVYGSLMVALFWSYTNSIMDLEQAKGAYGLIISIAQLGAISGATLATHSKSIGIATLSMLAGLLIFTVSLLVKAYHIIFRKHFSPNMQAAVIPHTDNYTTSSGLNQTLAPDNGYIFSKQQDLAPLCNAKSTATDSSGFEMNNLKGFYEGFLLVCSSAYTMKLLGISCLFEIVVTVLDFEFKLIGAASSAISEGETQDVVDSIVETTNALTSHDNFANLLGHFGQLTNMISFVVSLFGFSYVVHSLGVKRTLMIFPAVLFVAVVLSNLAPSLSVLFFLVSLLKGLIFSLSEPVKELLYIPTSEQVKFKAKAWIDVFGSRLAKAMGSGITLLAHGDARRLRAISEIPCIVLSLVILLLAWSVGTQFEILAGEGAPLAHISPGKGINSTKALGRRQSRSVSRARDGSVASIDASLLGVEEPDTDEMGFRDYDDDDDLSSVDSLAHNIVENSNVHNLKAPTTVAASQPPSFFDRLIVTLFADLISVFTGNSDRNRKRSRSGAPRRDGGFHQPHTYYSRRIDGGGTHSMDKKPGDVGYEVYNPKLFDGAGI